MKKHTIIIGSQGSGKTTYARTIIGKRKVVESHHRNEQDHLHSIVKAHRQRTPVVLIDECTHKIFKQIWLREAMCGGSIKVKFTASSNYTIDDDGMPEVIVAFNGTDEMIPQAFRNSPFINIINTNKH